VYHTETSFPLLYLYYTILCLICQEFFLIFF
jgi:hypothetical protein